MKKNRWIIVTLLILSILFIWAQSTLDQERSAAESGFFFQIINRFFPWVTHNLVRKAAHITEFFVMTVLLCKTTKNIGLQLFIGLLIALLDETIQLFTMRGSSVIDVWIDMIGVLLAIILSIVIPKARKKAAV